MKDVSKTIYAQVSVNKYAGTKPMLFSYKVKNNLALKVGDICVVPFRGRRAIGIVYELTSQAPTLSKKLSSIDSKLELPSSLPKYMLDLAEWLMSYYGASASSVWATLLPSGLNAKVRLKTEVETKSLKPLHALNATQKKALTKIMSSKISLLHGITGSGKTEVYLAAIADTYKHGKSSILLVPEIMLTTQLENRLKSHFDNVITLHSKLTAARRKQLWLECLGRSAHEPLVILGARSALFSALHNIGLIIIDEEHENSYKQESAPRYEAFMVAAKICSLSGARLVVGSATPSLRTYWLSKNTDKIAYIGMTNRYKSELPNIELVDISSSKDSILSSQLQRAITETLTQSKQVLLLLNRRGSAHSMICQSCSQSVQCPNCAIGLSFHADTNELICHYCEYHKKPNTSCDTCGSTDYRFVGDGTKKLESEIHRLWPNAKVARVDKDNSKIEHLKDTYNKMHEGKLDILLGTQMISRGLDIANLTLVGVVNADSSMAMPDFRAQENTFSLLTQVSGRAGRRNTAGKVIIQTSNPQGATLQAVVNHSFEQFYNSEIESRKKFTYPPFVYLLKLSYKHRDKTTARSKATLLAKNLQSTSGVIVLGPTKYYRDSFDKKSIFQIIVKSKKRKTLLGIMQTLPTGWVADIDPITLI